MQSNNQHQFACYYSDLSSFIAHDQLEHTISFNNPALTHRIFSVLRMRAGDTIILFDQAITITLELVNFSSKKLFSGIVQNYAANKILSPAITVLLPLLKKEALEDALYSCVELGATEIQLVSTQKTHRV